MANRPALLLLLLAAVPWGCTTVRLQPSVLGRSVRVEPPTGTQAKPLEGELLAVTDERIWIRSATGVTELPVSEGVQVRVQRHSFTRRKTWIVSIVGAVVSGVGMSAACSSVEGTNGCGTVGLAFAGGWLLTGALAAPSLDASSQIKIDSRRTPDLRPFARFPQGPPPGVDLLALGPPEPRRR
jgi:hypothetical protein